MSRIQQKFSDLKEKNKAALVTYVTAGDPDMELTPDIVLKLEESGADIVELGVPFSDPMADGPSIQLASERSLKSGTTLKRVLESVTLIRKTSDIPILIFGYYNPFYAYGLKEFAEDAKEAGVDGALVVDLPPEEAVELKRETERTGLDLVFLLSPISTPDRISLVAKNSRGFVYLVSVTGVTGARPDMEFDLKGLTKEIRKQSNLPVGIGFGVSSAKQVEEISKIADAVIVGSALVDVIGKYDGDKDKLLDSIGGFVKILSNACFRDRKNITTS